ncbi:MAG: cupin domain-containing protein [Candidatus Cloacimonetes bacterium]|nr:cupin domain-containing protein [Candidatus Cloacimonadota bacterium]
MKKISLKELIKEIKETWEPRNVAFINETALRIAKIEGAYNWHTHLNEDEFFLVLKGKICIDTEDGSTELNEMEGYLVKKGIRHRSRTEKPAWILLIEPIRTKTKGE